jgi:hypothetical protein
VTVCLGDINRLRQDDAPATPRMHSGASPPAMGRERLRFAVFAACTSLKTPEVPQAREEQRARQLLGKHPSSMHMSIRSVFQEGPIQAEEHNCCTGSSS